MNTSRIILLLASACFATGCAAPDLRAGGVMLGSVFIPMMGGMRDFPYFHAIYGNGWLLTSSAPPK